MAAERHILLVTARAPWPTASGGQQRTFLLAQAIRRVASLHTLLVDPKPSPAPADLDVMREQFGLVEDGMACPDRPSRWVRILNPGRTDLGHSETLSRRVTETARQLNCDTIVFRYLPLAGQAMAPGKDGIVRLVDIDDVPSLRTRTEAAQERGLRRFGKRWVAHSTARWQEDATARSDGGWVSCEEDLAIIGDPRFEILPNIPLDAFGESVDPELCRQDAGSASVLFVGAMGYAINAQAVDWFVERVWPIVVERNPAATFRIAGGGMDTARRARYAGVRGVEVLGYVEDLAGAYAQCALSVVPIFAGAGTKIKVLESIRYGRPVVLTRHSFRGYGATLEDGRDVAVADEPQAMAEAILRLIESPRLREDMARSGQPLVEAHFGFERFAAAVRRGLERTVVG